MNWRRHARFLAPLGVGLSAALALPMAVIDRTLAGGNLFFATYLLLAMRLAHRQTSADLRRHGQEDDEGAYAIVLLALGAVMLCLGAVIETMGARPAGLLRPAMAIASVPLGWATLHMVMAFHYARLFYATADAPGLEFPGTPDPAPWDFIYFSMTIGMTAQTSDVAIRTTRARKVATLHGALSFFFNTVLLALAVNLALSLG